MSSYTTREAVRIALARDLEVQQGTAASTNDDLIDDAIIEASNEIDVRLAGRYTVPFAVVPSLIGTIARDIAAYMSDLTFREVRDYNSELNPVILRWKRATSMLQDLQEGKITIPGLQDPQSGSQGEAVVAIQTDRNLRLMTPCDFDLWPRQTWWP